MIRIVLASFVFLAACAKVDDLGHLQEEGIATAKSYTPRLDELQHRADAVLARGADAARGSDPNETQKARTLLDRAIQLIGDMRSKTTVASSEITSAAKSGSFDEVERKIDDLRRHMQHGIVEANGDLDAVESWLAQAEMQAKIAPAAPEPAEPGEPPSGETPPPPAPEDVKSEPKPGDATKTDAKQPADAPKQPAPKQPTPKQPAPPAPKQPGPPKQG